MFVDLTVVATCHQSASALFILITLSFILEPETAIEFLEREKEKV